MFSKVNHGDLRIRVCIRLLACDFMKLITPHKVFSSDEKISGTHQQRPMGPEQSCTRLRMGILRLERKLLCIIKASDTGPMLATQPGILHVP